MTRLNSTGIKLSQDFYQADNVVELARQLIGKKICSQINGELTSATITETEAYRSWGDQACHANNNKRTKRTEVMFSAGGRAYIYLCYGIHHLFNVVTNVEGTAEAVLIRAVEPLEGISIMEARRNKKRGDFRLSSGPGNVSKALGITTALNGASLTENVIWLEEAHEIPMGDIVSTTRIGVDYAGKDALHPWRFYHSRSQYVSVR